MKIMDNYLFGLGSYLFVFGGVSEVGWEFFGLVGGDCCSLSGYSLVVCLFIG